MPRYTDQEVKKITKIQLDMVNNKIPFEAGERSILMVHPEFPVRNLKSYNKNLGKYLSGVGCYGPKSLPANWAKALLEATNYNSNVIQALKQQQNLYLQRDGKINNRLAQLLDGF